MLRKILFTLVPAIAFTSCIDDSVTTDSSQQPTFSTNNLVLAPLLNGQASPTYKFMVYNKGSKGIAIDHITVTGNDDNFFRFNVDGHWAESFSDVVIRGGDSIYVFVDAQVPETSSSRSCTMNFLTAGRTTSVSVEAPVIQATVLNSPVVSTDDTWNGNYYIKGEALVENGATLTLSPGTNLYFTDNSSLNVSGSLVSEGTPQQPVVLQGDRFDDIVPEVSYEIVADQWSGVTVDAGASAHLTHTIIVNAIDNLAFLEGSKGTLVNSRLHNASGVTLSLFGAELAALGCEITDAATNVMKIVDSKAELTHCTISNNYIMDYPVEPMIYFEGNADFNAANSIIYGLASEINDYPVEAHDVYFRNCLFLSPGSDDDNFIGCLWDVDPLLNVDRSDYRLDYSPLPDSPVFGKADPLFTPSTWTTDFYGHPVASPAAVGAYQHPVTEPTHN